MEKLPTTGVLSDETKTSDFVKPRLADAAVPPHPDEIMRDIVKKLKAEIQDKQVKILLGILKAMGLDGSESTFKRITMLTAKTNPNYHVYYLDYQSETELFLMEFEVKYSDSGEPPIIEVNAPVDVGGFC